MACSCPICMEEFKDVEKDDIVYLPCTHSFHNSCLMEYMERKVQENHDIVCPLCRQIHISVTSQDYAFIRRMIVNASKDVEDKTLYPVHVINMTNVMTNTPNECNKVYHYKMYIIFLVICVILCVSIGTLVKML